MIAHCPPWATQKREKEFILPVQVWILLYYYAISSLNATVTWMSLSIQQPLVTISVRLKTAHSHRLTCFLFCFFKFWTLQYLRIPGGLAPTWFHLTHWCVLGKHAQQVQTDMASNCNSIVSLRELPFSRWNNADRLAFKELGPPRPNSNIKHVSPQVGKAYSHRFSWNWYEWKTWLAGCEVANALFCYP